MANILTIDLDNLMDEPERGKRIAAMILSFMGIEPEPLFFDLRQTAENAAELIENFNNPADAFGSIENKIPPPPPSDNGFPAASTVLGPSLVIPNLTSAQPTETPTSQTTVVLSAALGRTANLNFDVNGLPWDQRIHSSQRTFNADGTWRMKRGIEKALVTSVEAELRQLMSIPSPLAQTVPTTSPVSTVAQTPPPPPPPSNEPVILPPADAATLAANQKAYLDLMTKVSSALSQGRINQDQLKKLCDGVGLPNFMSLGVRLDLVAQITPLIDALLAANAEG